MLPQLRLLSLALLLGSCSQVTGPDDHHDRPDILLFVVDTLRKDHLSSYGYPRLTSPNLDRLASEGVLFEDPVSQCSWTKPSMVSMFSGRYVTEYRDIPFPDAPTLAQTFQRAGYRTIGVVGNVLLSEEGGFARGFDDYDARHSEDEVKGKGGQCRPLQDLARDLWPVLERALQPDENGDRPPLFVYVHAMDPHNPYVQHRRFREELPLKQARPLEAWQHEQFAEVGKRAPADDPEWRSSWRRMEHHRGAYDQEIRHTDELIGEMLERYKQLGLVENAVFALVADHGEVLYDHPSHKPAAVMASLPPHKYFHQEHGSFQYQSLIGTPFILWGQGVPAGVRVEEPVENVDLYPTLLQLADIAPPAGLHGRSLVALMRGEQPSQREFVYSSILLNRSVREVSSDLKLVVPTQIGIDSGMQAELFDLSQDPQERVDLSGERPEDVARLRSALEAWHANHPTESSLGRQIAAREQRDLEGLGYVETGAEDDDDSAGSGTREASAPD